MCNLYSMTTNQEAIRNLFRVVNRYVGNLPPNTMQDFARLRSGRDIDLYRRPNLFWCREATLKQAPDKPDQGSTNPRERRS